MDNFKPSNNLLLKNRQHFIERSYDFRTVDNLLHHSTNLIAIFHYIFQIFFQFIQYYYFMCGSKQV